MLVLVVLVLVVLVLVVLVLVVLGLLLLLKVYSYIITEPTDVPKTDNTARLVIKCMQRAARNEASLCFESSHDNKLATLPPRLYYERH